jgi:hypothetical protein
MIITNMHAYTYIHTYIEFANDGTQDKVLPKAGEYLN